MTQYHLKRLLLFPSKFTFTDDKGETKDVIIVTEGRNENFSAGQSATQESVTYPFYAENAENPTY